MHIVSPYLLFIGDATDQLSIKMARGQQTGALSFALENTALQGVQSQQALKKCRLKKPLRKEPSHLC